MDGLSSNIGYMTTASDLINDDTDLTFPCEKCGQEFTQSIGRLKSENKLICTECGNSTPLDREQIAEHVRLLVEATDKALSDFGESLKDI